MITKERYFEVLKEAIYYHKAQIEYFHTRDSFYDKYLNYEKLLQCDVFHVGLYLAYSERKNDIQPDFIEDILNNLVDREKDPNQKIIKAMMKEAVLNITSWEGNEFIIKINSVTPFSLRETIEDPEIKEYFFNKRLDK
jgi:hypothetical protein